MGAALDSRSVGFSVKWAVWVLIVGVLAAGVFSLHRLQAPSAKTCHYKNWTSPCHTSGWHADWTDISAFAIVLGAAAATGVIGGSRGRTRRTSASAPQSR